MSFKASNAVVCSVEPNQKNWDIILPYVVFAYNTAVSKAWNEAPFKIIFGRQPPNPLVQEILPKTETVEWSRQVEKHLENVSKMVKEIEESSIAESQKDDPKNPFKVGSLVWMTSHLVLSDGAIPKLKRRFRGPYVVTKTCGPVNVRIRPVASQSASVTVHINNLKPFVTNKKKSVYLDLAIHNEDSDDDGTVDQESSESFEIEQVVDYRITGNQLEFLVKWKGYESDQNSWVNERDMNSQNLVEAFFQKLGARQ